MYSLQFHLCIHIKIFLLCKSSILFLNSFYYTQLVFVVSSKILLPRFVFIILANTIEIFVLRKGILQKITLKLQKCFFFVEFAKLFILVNSFQVLEKRRRNCKPFASSEGQVVNFQCCQFTLEKCFMTALIFDILGLEPCNL